MQNNIETIRHSLAHIMASAVLELFPKTKLGIGPAIDNGFYYDFEFPRRRTSGNLNVEDLQKIEEKMKEIIAQNQKFEKHEISKIKAKKIFKDQPYKLELIKELPGKIVSVYESGNFVDLCKGPHIKSTKEIIPNTFKLTKIAGAYWKGDEKNKMLTRIYGVAFETEKELINYIKMQEEAEKRDHRKLGKDLKIFTFSDIVGPGLPLWLPNGAAIIEELEKLAKETEKRSGYLQVKTPHIAKEIMYKTSGHLPYYADTMFPPMILEENGQKTAYYLKAMNCPHHHQIYASEKRSYRNLPLRLAEYGTCYRYEKSGELFGLMRVRSMQMNDAHIYCAEDQFADEFMAVIKMYLEYFKIFGIEKYLMRFSTHSKDGLGKKYIDNEKLWKKTESMARDVMIKEKIPFVEVADEAAFYGPKIDVEIWSAIGREFSLATNQVDFAVPERFDLTYTDKNGKEKTPICIHRAPLGTHERTIGFLIEHYAGAFPLWLSPVQVAVMPISEKHSNYADQIKKDLERNNIRAELKNENETLGKKIREAEMQKIPYLLIVGDKEIEAKTISVRERGKGDIGQMPLDKFIETAREKITKKN
ncbi:MAG: threonyl-tRNA synthetase [Parcubacteria group bacterium Licking1014_1]|nr:MAG: threonyl-tRNA synthetase [Parcubacteria group bacterium Licking1014_1]